MAVGPLAREQRLRRAQRCCGSSLASSDHGSVPTRLRPRDCRSGSRPRSSPAGRSRSSRRPARDCASALRRPGAWRSAPAWRRRSRAARARSATAAVGRQSRSRRATSLQIVCASIVARRLDQTVGGADRDRQAARESENPFRRAVDDAEDRRHAGRRRDAEMRVDDGAELGRHHEARHQRRRGLGGTARMTASSGASATVSPPKSSAVDACRRRSRSARSWCSETHVARRAAADASSAGSISVAPSPSRAISGRQAAPAGGERLAHHRRGQRGRALGGSMLSAASSSGSTRR